ncbi:MAG TPA: carboxypeptidase regulatory-like domain-containing protein [Gemmatimonadales bacterium]|nr:carboxypeptidase regulatory-like domain-containing protein [Gemmatimonadales bacterium]
MQSWFRRVATVAVVGVLFALGAGTLSAQGVTTAAVSGTVKQESGAAVEGAIVTITNRSTGAKLQATSQANGRFYVENVPVGGPYTIEARAIGFEAARRDNVTLALGQRFISDFALKAQVVQVEEIAVSAETGDPVMNTAKTGVAQSIGNTAITRLPVLGGNFTNLVATTPQVAGVSGGVSAGGQNNRFNSIQIDGGVNNDLFGLGSTGAPGGQADARAISFAAVKEFQVLIAPYDVRQGNFAGGLINAVTQSGTNQFHGSVFGRYQNQDLVGTDVNGLKSADFKVLQYGGTLGGAIIQDKLQYFFAADISDRTTPFDGITLEESGAAPGDAERMIDHLTTLGADQWGGAGSAGGFLIENPNPTYFGKLTWAPAANHNVALSYNNVGASVDVISRRQNGDWQLTSGAYSIENQTNSLRLSWNAVFGGKYSNEFIGGIQTIRDTRPPNTTYPTILVRSGTTGTQLVAGAERFSQDNSLDQDIYELTDNLTVGLGDHRLTIGTHNEFFGFNNHFFPQSIGQWTFANIDSFENNAPVRFDRALPLIPGGPVSDFSVNQWGLYAQDQFNLGNVALTIGLRWDDPIFPDSPTYNPTLDSITSDGALWTGGTINTSVIPSGNATWSPRLGFNWDVDGSGMTIVRGGVGYFGGRPAYVWMSNAYVNTGMAQTQLTCRNDNASALDDVPAFSLDPDQQPTTCGGAGGVIPPIPTINYFDPDFKFEQNMKLSLGVDHRLPWGVVGTIDLLYTKTKNSLYIQDNNLQGVVDESTLTYATGEGNRARYGVNAPTTGVATPLKQTAAFGNVLEHLNKSEDYAFTGTIQLQKRFSNGVEFNGGYTYSEAKDVMSLTSSIAFSNYGFATLNGLLNDRDLTTSTFSRPHRVVMSGTVNLPADFEFSLIYSGVSGSPFGYVINGDANADGVGGTNREFNDMVYVPRDRDDISMFGASSAAQNAAYDSLAAFIADQSCLRNQRGQIMERNSCRNPWINRLDARLTKLVPTFAGQTMIFSLDVFNLLNMIDSDWGLVKQTSTFEGQTLVRLRGWDNLNNRGIYSLSLPIVNRVDPNSSVWRIQLSGKYIW